MNNWHVPIFTIHHDSCIRRYLILLKPKMRLVIHAMNTVGINCKTVEQEYAETCI